jgi:hypothetical protein
MKKKHVGWGKEGVIQLFQPKISPTQIVFSFTKKKM